MSLASRIEAEEATKKEETIGRLQTENQVRTYHLLSIIYYMN